MRVHHFRSAALALASFVLPAAADAAAPGFLHDPVITYTNGMRLASSTPLRSHDVYYRCAAGQVGYCGGRMVGPMRDDWRSLGTRRHGRFQPTGPAPRRVGGETPHASDGLEFGDGEVISTVAADAPLGLATP